MPRIAKDPSVPIFDFQLNPDKSTLSTTTVNIYKSYLNKITAASYKQSLIDKRKKPIINKNHLLAKGVQVVSIINTLAENRQAKCGYYSAVFYAIGKKNLKRNKKMSYITEEFRKIYNNDEYEAYKAKKAEEATNAQNTIVEE